MPTAELKDNGDGTFSASWKPFWPLKVVSGDPAITGKRKPGGALRISIVPAVDGASRAVSAPRYGWVLQLRNTAFDVRGEDMTYRDFRALATVRGGRFERSWVDDAGTPADPADDLTYKGLSLRRLVARIDDGDPATFNKVRAAKGYAVIVQAMDGFSATYTSAELMTIGAKIIVADRLNDAVARSADGGAQGQRRRHVLRLLEAVLAAQGRERRPGDHRQAQAGRGAAHQHRAAASVMLRGRRP